MEECKRMGLVVLGPDVNESGQKFTVNAKGEIRFGLAAMKGIGTNAVKGLIKEREENGEYKSVFDFVKRVELRAVNRKSIETLVLGGAFDSLSVNREQFFVADQKGRTFLETLVKFGNNYQESKNSSQVSLFGESSEVSMPEPIVPPAEEWMVLEKYNKEKDVVGVYISGHPLDDYKMDIEAFCNCTVEQLNNVEKRLIGQDLRIGGMVTGFRHMVAKNGNPWGLLTISDYTGSIEVRLFKEDYLKFKMYFQQNLYLFFTAKFSAPSWMQNAEPRLKIVSMEFLDEIRDKFAKNVNITIDIEGLNTPILEDLEALCVEHQGAAQMNLKFESKDKRVSLNAAVRRFKVDPNNTFLKALKAMPYMRFKLSQKDKF
jgi:DNA polymerase-3 subunit alpha